MIHVSHLTKRFRSALAVDDLSFDVHPGVVTGFLGPNGSGKSTSMRLILGLDRPDSGQSSINGRAYRDLVAPLREVGALLDATAVHPGRSARQHLRSLAASNDIESNRVDAVLDITGIASVADKKVGSFSLGMSQRLGIAAALLGNPSTLLFDEPLNGLDPEGIRWMRNLFQTLASEGRTVFVSSHLMGEMALVAERIIVIGRGRLIREGTIDELVSTTQGDVFVQAPDRTALSNALARHGIVATPRGDGFVVVNAEAEMVGRITHGEGVALSELSTQRASLEDIFMQLTQGAVDYQSSRSPESE